MSSPLERLRTLSRAAGRELPAARLTALAAVGLARGLLETAVVVQVIAIAFAAAGEHPDGLPVLAGVQWTPLTLVAAITATTAATAGTQWLSAALVSSTSTRAVAETRLRLLHGYTGASWLRQASERTGSLEELMATSSAAVGQGTITASTAIVAAAQLAVMTAAAVTISPVAGLGVLVVGVLVVLVAHPFRARTRRLAVDAAGVNGEVTVLVAETTALHRDLRTNGVEGAVLDHADDLVRRSARLFGRVRFEAQVVPALTRDVTILAVAAGLAAISVAEPTGVGSLGATVALLVRAIGYGQQVSAATHSLGERRAHLARLDAALARFEGSSDDGRRHRTVESVGTVRFERASFRYPHATVPALEEIDVSITPGELVGIVGPTGAGKSTLVHLLLGLVVPTSGRVTVDGTDLAEVRLDAWHRLVAFVPQDPRLLTGTVAENIRFLRSGISDAAVQRAVDAAALGPDLGHWEDGLDHHVGPLGSSVSGGQRQRIALARALAGAPELLVLDEPTSALDPHSEAAVRTTIEAVRGGTTVLVVAHRLSTLRACDRLLVIQDGHVAADGAPDRLAAEHDYYREALLLSGLRP